MFNHPKISTWLKEDTGEPSVLPQEINLRTYSQAIQAKYLPQITDSKPRPVEAIGQAPRIL